MFNVRPASAAARACAAPAAFFTALRPFFGGSIGAGQVAGMIAKLTAFDAAGSPLAHVAYGLATSWWETGRTMQPAREAGHGAGQQYGKPGAHGGQIPYGRGDVQLTWDTGYERADRELGLHGALLADFDLALRPDISAQIMVRGMGEGWFTGRRFADYLPASGPASLPAMTAARAIINGRDRAAEIAVAAQHFQAALAAGGWS